MHASNKAVDSLLDSLEQEEWEIAKAALANLDDEELYEDSIKPVDIVTFCDDPQFLGNVIKAEPQVLQLLWLIEEDHVREAYAEVGKGSGKSFIASIFSTYGAYRILAMRRPQLFFGLSSATIIASINVSINQLQAREVIFEQTKELVKESPWFRANTKFLPKAEELVFNKRVTLYCGHSNSTAFLGYATIRAVLDESNFMINNQNRNVAESLFSALKGSCNTRFPYFYKILSISSASTPGAWLHNEVNLIKKAGQEVPLTPQGLSPADVQTDGSSEENNIDDALEGIFEDEDA